jgi:hypothetical protein
MLLRVMVSLVVVKSTDTMARVTPAPVESAHELPATTPAPAALASAKQELKVV